MDVAGRDLSGTTAQVQVVVRKADGEKIVNMKKKSFQIIILPLRDIFPFELFHVFVLELVAVCQ